jgi:hypothetical protein
MSCSVANTVAASSVTDEGHVVCLAYMVREDVCIVFRYLQVLGLKNRQPPHYDLIAEPKYKLFVVAHAPPAPGVPDLFLRSPCAILDVYVGRKDAGDAPSWTRWSKSHVYFRHRISSFTAYFIQLADTKLNSDQVRESTTDHPRISYQVLLLQPGLSLQMVAWARCFRNVSDSDTSLGGNIMFMQMKTGSHRLSLCTPKTQRVFQNTGLGKKIVPRGAFEESPTNACLRATFVEETGSDPNWDVGFQPSRSLGE